MLKSYIKIAVRNLWKNKAFSLLNISGLAVGMASSILILLWIANEVSYDRFHANADRTYELWNRVKMDGKLQSWNVTPKILGPTLREKYPDFDNVVRVNWNNSFLFTIGDRRLTAPGTMVDTGFLKMFDFPMVKGNPRQALKNDFGIVLTEKLARKLFGDEDPMNKEVRVENKDNFTVTGVLKDLPNNTQFDFEYLIPWSYMDRMKWNDSSWDNNSVRTYASIRPGITQKAVEQKIRHIKTEHGETSKTEMFLHPMEKWRLYSRFDNGQLAGGRIEVVRLLGLIAGLILLIACINFMNLSTARSERRAKEVGIRKVVGVHKRLLVAQFLGESVFLAFLAALIAVALVHLSLPAFNELTEKRLFMDYSNPWFWISALSFILLTGVVAGTYPAFYLSSFQPIKVLKGTFAPVKGAITPRKVLVVLQFTIAITLIVSTLIVRRQIQYAQDRENGYSKDNLMYHMFTGEVDKNYALIRNELLQSGMALSVNKTSAPVTENWSNSWGFEWAGKDPNNRMVFNRYCADGHLASTMGFQFIKGRDMDPEKYKSDSMACVLNEAAVKAMGFKDPIGQVIKDGDSKFTVVGVVKNFILSSPFQPIEPMIIQGSSGWFNVVNIKLDGRQPTAKALARVEGIFKKYNPEYPFEYKFVDEEYARKFNDERRTQSLATVFAALAIFISCLGLFGLAAYTAESRTKEIGVRKVLGASVSSITALLSRDFLKLVLISIILAIPLAWWGMTKWLENFEYRAPMSWWIFILSGVLALLIAFATVSVQAVKAALSNPVRNLRSE